MFSRTTRRQFAVLALLCLGICLIASCKNSSSSNGTAGPEAVFEGDYPIKATVTVGMVADLVRAIGGDHIEVEQLMGAGVDPHVHKPNRDDSIAIRSADIVFYSGLMLEGKMAEMLDRVGAKRRTFAAAESLPVEILADDPEQESHPDPHVWMNVDLWRQVSSAIAKELETMDPTNAEAYATSQRKLDTELKALHQYGIQALETVPVDQRVLITSHDAFRYFGEAYGIQVEALQGISTESEAGLWRINQLVDLIVERKIKAIFIESSVPKEDIESLIAGSKSRGHEVTIGGSLYSDAMGNTGTYEGTYIGMMDHNLTTIAKALGGAPPAGGFQAWRKAAMGSENSMEAENGKD